MTGPDTPTDAEALAAALDAHNRWRRDDDGIEPEPNPTELGRTIDAAAGMLRTLSERVAALEAERAALNVDAERLDWFADHVICIEDDCTKLLTWHVESDVGYHRGDTIREAIDAARAPTPGDAT